MSMKMWVQVGLGGLSAVALGTALDTYVVPHLQFDSASRETITIVVRVSEDRIEFEVINESNETIDLARLSFWMRSDPGDELSAYPSITKVYSSDRLTVDATRSDEDRIYVDGSLRQYVEPEERDRFVFEAIDLPETLIAGGYFETKEGLKLPITHVEKDGKWVPTAVGG